jgi:hypothetical protein
MIMEVDVVNMEGQKIRTVELPAQILKPRLNVDLMHQHMFVRWLILAWVHIAQNRAERSPVVERNPGNKKGPAGQGPVQSGLPCGGTAELSLVRTRAIFRSPYRKGSNPWL